ncbi:MAG TPA: SMC-Scp complex subunit ScpB, partial [Microthrixaceae bacterium]|nr:SMC-Scp complex subunit ScpB [Microthrixaceae bacterium]
MIDDVPDPHDDVPTPGDGLSDAPDGRSDANETRRALEAIVMVADEPADPRLLAQLLEVSPDVVEALCEELAAAYEREDRGFELVKVAGGWRFQSHTDLAPYVERFVLTGQSARLSAAALETLAIVAYKQPISRSQVSAIRGVNVDAVMRTLNQRGYIAELARDPGPGQAVLFGTTGLFLDKLGINGLDELPGLGEFVPGPEVLEALEAGLRVDGDESIEAPVEDLAEDPGDGRADTSVERSAVSETPDDQFSDDGVTLTVVLADAPVEPEPSLDALEVLADRPGGGS